LHKNEEPWDLKTELNRDNLAKIKENSSHKETDSVELLKNQIEELETNEDYEAKLRYESEAYILNKRRK
jgi:hypothetical protein